MNVAIVDYRRKPRRYYVLKPDAINSDLLPAGMRFDRRRDEIIGNPSPVNWKEVKREDFVGEVTKRSK